MNRLYKYPRTPHLTGSRVQPGDEDLRVVAPAVLKGRDLIIEEKVDGANCGISFSSTGELLLQSRGHFLDGGPRERHFGLLKSWATCHQKELWETLGSRYVMYGEWLYAKHTIFYDHLTHYFFEFDVLDLERGFFLASAKRRELLSGLPVVSVPIIGSGHLRSVKQLRSFIAASALQTAQWRNTLIEVCQARSLDADRALRETDAAGLMEGLYIKVEDEEQVIERYKFVRESFLQAVEESDSHWLERPIIPNQLRAEVDLFAKAAKAV